MMEVLIDPVCLDPNLLLPEKRDLERYKMKSVKLFQDSSISTLQDR
jgi:hypothetical protein